jgi:hypothetical protein
VRANSNSLQAAVQLNFINTASMQVSVSAGSTGNANIAFTSLGNTTITSVSINADQNNYNPAGLAGTTELRITPSNGAYKLTGLTAQTDGTQILIVNNSDEHLLWLEHENTSSTAANRFSLPSKFPAFLMPKDSIRLLYNGTSSRWVVIEWESQGQGMGLTFLTDFIEGVTAGLTSTISGTGASVQTSAYLMNATEKPCGITQIDSGTTSTGRSTLGNGFVAQWLPTYGAALHVSRLAIETTNSGTETFNVWTGFADVGAGSAANTVAWRNDWSGSASLWYATSVAGGTTTANTTNSPTPDNNYIWLGVYMSPTWNRAHFFYSTDSTSFVVANTMTSGLPSSTQPVSWSAASIIKRAGTGQRNVTVDLAGHRFEGGARG